MIKLESIPPSNEDKFFWVRGQLYLDCTPAQTSWAVSDQCEDSVTPPFFRKQDDFVSLPLDGSKQQLIESSVSDFVTFKFFHDTLRQLHDLSKRSVLGVPQNKLKKTDVKISGSGIIFTTNQALEKNQVVMLKLFFHRLPFCYLQVAGFVTQVQMRTQGRQVKIQYQNISKKNRQTILTFVNECQRSSSNATD